MLPVRKCLAVIALMLSASVCTGQAVDSIDIKIGQMVLIGVSGTGVDEAVMAEVSQGKVGGIIFFEKNIPPSNSFDGFSRVIWQYQRAAPIPLFMCIDQEGGKVNRLKPKYGFPRSVTAAEMGAAATPDTVRYYARTTAATLAGLGLNVNFAPCVDLASNPDNPVIARYGRAFSADEKRVAELAADFIREHRRMNVITAPKHFPGHGSSKDDTHLGMADVTETWEGRELYPYRQLIGQGLADAIMSAHIVNRKLDPDGLPGTLSKEILDGILRKKLGFEGVVFSDDMQMHAITRHYGLEQAIMLAINAGIDVMTFSNNIDQSEERTVDKVHRVIKDLVRSGKIPAERIEESYRRIIALKREYLYSDPVNTRVRQLEERISALEKQVKELQGN
jgi:beta-N-acetylhexosaminidase